MNKQDLDRQYATLLSASLPFFVRRVFRTVSPGSNYLHNWHIDLICDYLNACEKGDIKRLIINIPPRYLKSITVNVAWSAWLLGHNPSEKIISTSYADGIAITNSLHTRRVMQSEWYRQVFPHTIPAKDQDTKSKFVTTCGGQRLATSVGATTTGEGGNFIIVDDPLSSDHALSKAKREAANTWFDNTLMSRLDDKKKGVIVVIMQRLHQDDLTAHLIAKGGWEHLKIPLIASSDITYSFPTTSKQRQYIKGEVLHPEREDIEMVERMRDSTHPMTFSAQQLQEPVPLEGNLIKHEWLERYIKKPEKGTITQSWDTAFKDKEASDYSVCTTWLKVDGISYLIDCFRDRLQYPQLKQKMLDLAGKYNPTKILIEDKASGQSLIQDLRHSTHLPIVPIKVSNDKTTRLSQASDHFAAGRVMFPESSLWMSAVETELVGFPNAPHDDIVDSISQYINDSYRRAAPSIRRI